MNNAIFPAVVGALLSFWVALPVKAAPAHSQSNGADALCSALTVYRGANNDVSAALQNCIDAAPPQSVVELPPGVYTIASQIRIGKPLTLRTQGKTVSSPKCQTSDPSCAELVTSPLFGTNTVPADRNRNFVALFSGSDITVNHIIFNGNRANRLNTHAAAACAAVTNADGKWLVRSESTSNSTFAGNVVKNALCGSGWEFSYVGKDVAQSVLFINNTSAYNGDHGKRNMWSDGFTVHDAKNMRFEGNTVVNGTDVDVVFGGCQNCIIRNNTIMHNDEFPRSSFAALVLHAWPGTSGNYTGTTVDHNTIDCGLHFGCGFGLSYGAHAWYVTPSFGGSIHDNVIAHAQQGINIDGDDGKPIHDVAIYNNTVHDTAGYTLTNCGRKETSDYNLQRSDYSNTIDRSADTMRASYTNMSWRGCIPNFAPLSMVPNASVPTTADNLVNFLYGCILGRSPDPQGFAL